MPIRLGVPELVILLVILLLIFGIGRIGRIGKELGTAIREFRKGIGGGEKADDEDEKEKDKEKDAA
jgi:sec-independent protein translocase protein TatA